MTQTSSARVRVKRINQVALVVRDLQKVVESYWHILGIGPWTIYSWESPFIYDRRYRGKPVSAREKIALAQVGDIQLELCQPISGQSIYQDHLMRCGEGLHHLNFLADNPDNVVEALADQGFPSLQSGRYGNVGAFNYIDIEPLHAIWEVVHLDEKRGARVSRYPEQQSQSGQ
jgi:methylmalonyl-CoA/ethylmalonyl-CoA epimerase